MIVSVCFLRVYYSASRNHCICTDQDHGGQHGYRLQRHGHQDAAGKLCWGTSADLKLTGRKLFVTYSGIIVCWKAYSNFNHS